MKIHTGTSFLRLRDPVISIGVFDGVHRGHSAIFNIVLQRAKEIGGESAILTFLPHPKLVLGKKNIDQLKFLTSLDEKKTLIRKHGIDHLIIIPFTKEFSRLPACSFVKQYLVEGIGLNHLVFGFDHHFGHRREGNFENLKACAQINGFGLEQLEPVREGNCLISSSAIREALLRGNVKFASKLLSYSYCLPGKIIGGSRIGREIGYPTANIKPDDEHKLIPADGVYAVKVKVGQGLYNGMMNIGFRPTINQIQGDKSLEVHIMNFEADIYNQNININFIERIRDERKFSTLEQLKEQLGKDKSIALQILSGQTC